MYFQKYRSPPTLNNLNQPRAHVKDSKTASSRRLHNPAPVVRFISPDTTGPRQSCFAFSAHAIFFPYLKRFYRPIVRV